jgi:hypothetical protein
MRWSDIPRHPASGTLRRFAAIWLVWFAGLGAAAWFVRDDRATALILAAVALAVGPIGLLFPPLIRSIFVGAMVVTFPIGWVVSHLLLGAVFYCLFAPLGLLFRLIGRDALGLRRTSANSYWLPKPAGADLRSYFRQS